MTPDPDRAAPARFGIKERVGWIGVSPRFHLPEIGVLDPASPAAQAGLKTFDFITAVNGVPVGPGPSSPARHRAGGGVAAASQLPAGRLLGGAVRARRDRGAGLGGRHPGRGVRRRRAPPLRDRHPVGRAVRVLRRAGQPGRRIGLRRGDQIVELDGEPLAHWDLLRERLAADPEQHFQIAWVSPGGVRHEASFRQEVRSEMDAYRQEEQRLVFGALNRLAWKTDAPVPITEPLRLRDLARVRAHRPDHRRHDRRASGRSCAGACRCRRWAGRS